MWASLTTVLTEGSTTLSTVTYWFNTVKKYVLPTLKCIRVCTADLSDRPNLFKRWTLLWLIYFFLALSSDLSLDTWIPCMEANDTRFQAWHLALHACRPVGKPDSTFQAWHLAFHACRPVGKPDILFQAWHLAFHAWRPVCKPDIRFQAWHLAFHAWRPVGKPDSTFQAWHLAFHACRPVGKPDIRFQAWHLAFHAWSLAL